MLGDEICLVTGGAGTTTWTIVRGSEGTTAASHASGTSVFLVLTAASLLRCPRSMTTTGDVEYLDSGGAPHRLAAGGDTSFLRYSSGVPITGTIALGDLPAGLGLTASGLNQFAATTSAQLAGVISDETGSGALVFATSPSLTTPALGTPSAGVLTSCTGLPLTTGVTGILPAANGGTGVANSSTLTLGGNLTTSGAFATTFTMTAATGVTFPTTGTLATLAGAEAFTNKSGNISQWTNDSGYLTSVTAHNVLSATHGDTLAASVTRGDVIIGNSTPKWARLAIGSASRYLSSDGTDVSWGQVSLTAGVTGTLPVANGGTNASSASITAFNNITGYSAAGATGTTSTNLVFSTSPTLVTPVLGVASGTTLTLSPSAATGLTITGATETTSQPLLSLTQTWNASGTTFTFFKGVATTTASAAGSLLMDLWAGSTPASVFSITKLGYLNAGVSPPTAFAALFAGALPASTIGVYLKQSSSSAYSFFDMQDSGARSVFRLDETATLGFGVVGSTVVDTFLRRGGAAATLQLGVNVNGAPVNQTLKSHDGVTGTDVVGANFTLASGKGTGAGSVSSLIFQTPTVLTTGTTAQSLATRLTVTSGLVSLADATDLGIGTSTGSKIGQATSLIGFYGVTPITRAVLATGASHTVDDVITSLQNLGLVKQS